MAATSTTHTLGPFTGTTRGKNNQPVASNSNFLTIANNLLKLKVPYAWGQQSVSAGMDCSGLVFFILTSLGFKNVPRTAAEQAAWVKDVPLNAIKPGDLIFFHIPKSQGGDGQSGINHVAIYAGGGKIIQESGPQGAPINEVALSSIPSSDIVKAGSIPGFHYPSTGKVPNGWIGQEAIGTPKPTAPKNLTDAAIYVLTYLNIVPTSGAIHALVAQMQLENVNPKANNPGGLKNASGVIQFKNWQAGLNAYAQTIAANPKLITALEASFPNVASCSGYANALEHSQYEGSSSSANKSYGQEVAAVCSTVRLAKPTGTYATVVNQGAISEWFPGVTGAGPHIPNPIGGIAGAIEALANTFSGLASFFNFLMKIGWKGVFAILAGGLLILIALVTMFRHPIGEGLHEVKQKGEQGAAVVAAAA